MASTMIRTVARFASSPSMAMATKMALPPFAFFVWRNTRKREGTPLKGKHDDRAGKTRLNLKV